MGRIGIVTGATGGIGMKFVQALNGRDDVDAVWAVGRNREKLDKLTDSYGKVVPVVADLSLDGVRVLGDLLQKEAPDIRWLINNAGIAHMGPFDRMGAEDVEQLCAINCSAPAQLMSLALPYMHEGARIVNVSSASSFQPNPYLSMYSTSKVFLKNLSRALSMELKPRGITVTCVCPGWVDTGMLPKTKDGKKIRYAGLISADQVVRTALRDSERGKSMSVPGFFAKYFRFYSKIVPTGLIMRQWMGIVKKYL